MKILFMVLPLIATFAVGCASKPKISVDVFAVDPTFQKGKSPISSRKPTNQDGWTPDEKVFDDIYSYSSKQGFSGYDVIACYEGDKLKLGGVSFWAVGYTLFMDYAGGRMDIGVFHKPENPNGSATDIYTNGNLSFEITGKGKKGAYYSSKARVNNTRGEVSDYLDCYERNSGLE